MLSEATDGDYIVRRFLVKRQGDTDYSIRYQINLASLSAALDGNSRELDGLNAFVDNLMRDTLMNVKSVEITGYSSPDGPRAFNETLARNRARDFKSYVDKKYGFSKKYDVTLNSGRRGLGDVPCAGRPVARTRQTGRARDPRRETVVRCQGTGAEKDTCGLGVYDKAYPAAASPRRTDNQLRCGQHCRAAHDDPQAQNRTRPAEQACEPCGCEVVDESITGIIVEMPGDTDYRKDLREARREAGEALKDAGHYSKKELREARRIAREQERAARKIARKEAQAAKAAAKAGKKTYRELERM